MYLNVCLFLKDISLQMLQSLEHPKVFAVALSIPSRILELRGWLIERWLKPVEIGTLPIPIRNRLFYHLQENLELPTLNELVGADGPSGTSQQNHDVKLWIKT